MHDDLLHLQDYVDLVASSLELRVRASQEESESAIARNARTVELLRARIDARRLEHPELKSSLFCQRLGLTETELLVVWSLAALTLSSDARALFSQLTGDNTDPTIRGLKQLVYGELVDPRAFAELSEAGQLRRLGIVELAEPSAHDSGQVRLSQRVLALLHGIDELAAALGECTLHTGTMPNELAADSEVEARLRIAMRERCVVTACGLAGLGRASVLTKVAVANDLDVLHVDSTRLPKDAPSLVRQLRRIALECRLQNAVLLIADLDTIAKEHLALVGAELIAHTDGPVLATCGLERPSIRWDRPAVFIEMPRPSTQQLAELWRRELGHGTAERADTLATRYPLAPALIHHAAKAAKARAAGNDLSDDDITAGIRAVLDDRLGQFARRVTVTQTWEDIVLPFDQLEAISELISRVRGRRKVIEDWGFGAKVGKGLGVSALFSGPPGTGKTMLTALIAQDLGLELYQVDLGKVVSKWIGETEKNLGALFDAAEAGHAILLFDEADALFGKRTDVKSSNDRHANLETNYLLQRLESYTGVCLLTTNHDSHIDPAFQRRLSLHLRIELPEINERAELWRAMLPPAAPVAEDLDFESLARRYAMSGGYIRNAVLRAAFVAADRGKPITHDALERAARREYEGMGKIVFAA